MRRNPRVAYRYAKALVQLAVETNKLDEVKKDMDFLRAHRNEEFNRAMASPVIRGAKKSKVFRAVFHNQVSPLTESFFDLVFNKGREFVIRDISEAFDEQYNEIMGIINASIITAVPIEESLYMDLYNRIAILPRFKGKHVNLEKKVDPQIIGGFILKVADNKFDASIRHDLYLIKKEFLQNLYEMKY
jgi:F-type H+-transporting ATPase subunit delta